MSLISRLPPLLPNQGRANKRMGACCLGTEINEGEEEENA